MTSKYKQFRFESYDFDMSDGSLNLKYSYDGEREYRERIIFDLPEDTDGINKEVLDAVCFYTFVVAGSSYYKSFLVPEFVMIDGDIDYWQADFFNMIYRGGLSQFIYENELSPDQIAKFSGDESTAHHPQDYDGAGVLMMQSGGRDSLLTSELMKQAKNEFTSWHMSTTGKYPPVLDELGAVLRHACQLGVVSTNRSRHWTSNQARKPCNGC